MEWVPNWGLPEIYEALRSKMPFPVDNDQVGIKELITNNRTQAIILCGHEVDRDDVERILVVGITPGGYFASPQLILQRTGSETLEAFTIHQEKESLIFRTYREPWRPVVDVDGRLADQKYLGDFEFLAGASRPTLREIGLEPASLARVKELLERWGMASYFSGGLPAGVGQ